MSLLTIILYEAVLVNMSVLSWDFQIPVQVLCFIYVVSAKKLQSSQISKQNMKETERRKTPLNFTLAMNKFDRSIYLVATESANKNQFPVEMTSHK